MLDILLLEPSSSHKRRYTSKIFTAQGRVNRPRLDDIKVQLGEIRHYCVNHQHALVNELMTTVALCPDVDVTLAVDASQAVNKIKEISDSSPIAINKSAVITRELVPGLVSRGYPVIEPYYSEFKPFENRFTDYWQLPDMTLESRWLSFETPVNLGLRRRRSIHISGERDFVGLVGVNTLSAKEASVVMLQHMGNIGKIFEQAREIILVAGLDKIVRDLGDAIFQAKCMAIFGSETLPLSIQSGAQSEGGIEDLPFFRATGSTEKIHLILLDNGRSRILQSRYKDLLACIGCRACIKDCPTSRFFVENVHLSPKEYLYSFITGNNSSLALCLQSKTCRSNCPLDIDLPGMIIEAKIRTSGKHRPLSDKFLSKIDVLERLGSSMPWLAGILSNSRLLRRLGEKMTGISRERHIPRMQRATFAKWFRSREGGGEEDSEDC